MRLDTHRTIEKQSLSSGRPRRPLCGRDAPEGDRPAWRPYCDRRGRWVIDGDAVRWIGLTLFVAGCALRVWPIFVLGRRFSALVAIQEQHELVTDGPYRWIRNPSYLGGLISVLGWALVFRSVVGLVLAVLFVWLTIARIGAEEALPASEFGSQYAEYRRRTWRLLPWMY